VYYLSIKKYFEATDIIHDLIRDFVIFGSHLKEVLTAGARIVKNVIVLSGMVSPKTKKQLEKIKNQVEKWIKEQTEPKELEAPQLPQIEEHVRSLRLLLGEAQKEIAVNLIKTQSVLGDVAIEEIIDKIPGEAKEELKQFLEQFMKDRELWKKAGFSDEEAMKWTTMGFTLKQAIAYRQIKVPPDLATEIRKTQLRRLIA
jgi:hypothetical protein